MRDPVLLRSIARASLACGVAALVVPFASPGGVCSPEWIPTFGGYPGIRYGEVQALIGFDDGSGTALYVGGDWAPPYAGSVRARGIARWDGTSWSPLASGLSVVWDLAVHDDGGGAALYAAGPFTTSGGVTLNGVARWTGASWATLDMGVAGSSAWVKALAVYDDGNGAALYAAGAFATAGGVPAASIARWDGSSWTALGTGLTHGSFAIVEALAVFDDGNGPALYAGGQFDLAGGVPVSNIARWDGASWSDVGGGTNGAGTRRVYALCTYDGGGGPELVAGGEFTAMGAISPSRIARWNGTSWSTLSGGTNDTVWDLTVHDDGGGPDLYAAGQFSAASGVASSGVARWNGSSWSSVAGGTDLATWAAASVDLGSGPALFAGGRFEHAGGVQAAHIAEWDGTVWASLGDGLDGPVRAVTRYDDGSGPGLIAGGSFSVAAREPLSRIGRWDGTGWSALGSGTDGEVAALGVFDDGSGADLYAAGSFSTAGGISASNIARWDGSSWAALGSGLDGPSCALAVYDDGAGAALFAAGSFETAGGVPAASIARWDGSAWSALGTGLTGFFGNAEALAVYDDGNGPALYAGGQFDLAGGVPVSSIARWDGTSWSSLGTGVSGSGDLSVRALAVYDGGGGAALYAAGQFQSAGGVAANAVARWDGSIWSALGSGMGGSSVRVEALAVYDDGSGPALYAAGEFDTAGGATADKIARWDGSVWSPLDDGVEDTGQGDNAVDALTVFDDGAGPALYAGGGFNVVGDPASSFLARWGGCAKSPIATFCFGTSADCPCGNGGLPGRGCDNAQGTGGVELSLVTQTTSPNGATVTGSGFSAMGAPTALVFRSAALAATPAPFGDGLGCLSPAGVVRLAATTALSGTSTHAFGHSAMAGPGEFHYQIWYRNQPASFCTPAAFNLSNGVSLAWP